MIAASEPRPTALLHIILSSRLLKALKSDKRAIFTAASKAQQAVDWLLNLQI